MIFRRCRKNGGEGGVMGGGGRCVNNGGGGLGGFNLGGWCGEYGRLCGGSSWNGLWWVLW
jgi:hypothetical protein